MNLKLGSLYVLPLFALQIAGSGCNRANPQAAGPQLPPPPLVSVVRAEAQDVPVYLDEIGKSFASESVTVTPQVGGRIMQRCASVSSAARFGKGRSGPGKSGAGTRQGGVRAHLGTIGIQGHLQTGLRQ